jgi:hypothetical protein
MSPTPSRRPIPRKAGACRLAVLFAQDCRRDVRLGTRRSAGVRSSSTRRGSRSRDLGRDDLRLRRPVLPAVASPGRRGPQGMERPKGRNLDRPPSSPRPARPTVVARRPHVLPQLHRGLALARACKSAFGQSGQHLLTSRPCRFRPRCMVRPCVAKLTAALPWSVPVGAPRLIPLPLS